MTAASVNQIDTLAAGVETLPTVRVFERDERARQRIPVIHPSDATESQRVLAAKLSLPHQGFVLGRPRLRALVEPARAGGLITVVAGPGYGKTAFIVDLLSSAEGQSVYYAADESDRDPVRFLRRLMAGIGVEVAEPLATAILGWPGDGNSQGTVLELVAALLDFMSARSGSQTLVAIDDVHLLDCSPEVIGALELVARGLPPGWTMLITSRRPVELGLQAVDLGGRLVTLRGRELRLTPREVAAWASQNWDVLLQPSEARALWRLTEGWPAALALLGQHLLSGGDDIRRQDVVRVISRGRDLRAYLEAHIFCGMEPAAAQVVSAAGLLPRVVFPRDAEFLPGEPGEAEAVLEEFVSRGFMVTRTGRRSFTLHPLLRGYVEREAWREQVGTGLVERAADHLQQHGEVYDAARLFLRSHAWHKAAGPLRTLALSSLNVVADFADGDWLELISDGATDKEPWLLVAKARIVQRQTEYAAARILYERAAQLLSTANDREGLLSTLLGSTFCLFNQGLWEDSLSVLKRCKSLARSPAEKVEVLVCEGHVLVSLCRWDEAVENWEKALALTPVAGRPALAARLDHHRARLFYSLGHYRVARQWAHKALAACSQAGTPFRALALNGAAIVGCAAGDYSSAGTHAAECLGLARARGYGFIEISALLNQAAVALGAWDYRAAMTSIREAQDLARKADDAEELFWAEDMLGDLCRRNRNPRLALEHHQNALEIVARSRLAEFERVRALTGVGIDLILLGREKEGRLSLEEAVSVSRRLGLIGSLTPELFYLGWVYALAAREHEASRALTECMKLAAEHHHVHFFSQEAHVAIPILALCDRFGAGGFVREMILPGLPHRLQGYFHDLARGSTYPTDVALGPPRRKALSWAGVPSAQSEELTPEMRKGVELLTDREREVLKMVSLGMPNKVIGAKLFITEKTVKTHANHVFRKLGVTNRLQATLVFQSYQRARRAGSRGASPRSVS
ncbi:MAG TPA: LuxR C-terminal-related transcriptional regulator, partial [Thermoleophilia bacterium]|nr:LuxR C-terminal-related transcriptional regulator [Thermoleophilia bacterium]